MQTLQYPDYSNSNLNAINSILAHYGAAPHHPTHPILDGELENVRRNLVVLVLDGLGVDALERHAPADGFFRRNLRAEISAVFPCTTVAAMNTFYSGLSPAEHGWLGWSLYFKEYGRTVDTFLNDDSFDHSPVMPFPAKTLMPYQSVYTQLENLGVECPDISPFATPFSDCWTQVEDMKALADSVVNLSLQDGRRFALCYWAQPDELMHEAGIFGDEVGAMVRGLDGQVQAMFDRCEDTTLVVLADHGMAAIDRTLFITDYPGIMECLTMQPFIETRAASFFVKAGRHQQFCERFSRHLGDQFVLLSREQVFESGLLGPGEPHKKTLDFIGDYLAVASGSWMLRSRGPNSLPKIEFQGMHAGLKPEEMRVPLIVGHK